MFSRLIRRGSSRVSSVVFAERHRIVITHSMFSYGASGCALAPKRPTATSSEAKASVPAQAKRARQKKETAGAPRRTKAKAKEPKPVAEDPVESINVLRLVEEWRAACAEDPAAAGEAAPPAGDRGAALAGTGTGNGTVTVAVPGAAGAAAAMGAVLARAAKRPEERPALHSVLHARRAAVQQAEPVVRDTAQLCDLLAFLRVYRTSAFGCAAVHAGVMGALVSAASAWANDAAGVESGETDWGASPRAALLWLALELRLQKFRREPLHPKAAGRSDWVSAETASRLSAAITAATADLSFSSSAAATARTTSRAVSSRAPTPSVARGVAEFAMLSLADAPADATAAAESALDALLRPRDSFATAAAAQQRACDLLAALRLLALAEVALPPGTHERMRRGVSDAFQNLCATSGARPFVFADVLCAADVARSVCALPARDMRNAAEAAVFAGAALFCERASEEAVDALFSRAKRDAEPNAQNERGRSPKAEGEAAEAEEEEEFALQLRSDGDDAVELRSRIAKIAYALFAAGYAPDTVLCSGLCGSHGAADVLEILRAAALFSRGFAFAPLPPREAAAIGAEAKALVDRCIRDGDRAEALAEAEAAPPLHELLERSAAGDVAAVLRVSFAAAVEFLVRGEERRFADHFARLLALLEREGSWDYLVDGLALVADGFAERCRVCGTRGPPTAPFTAAPTAAAHRCLAEATALCASRVADAAQRHAARTRRTAAPSGSAVVECRAAALRDAALRLTATAAACGIDETAARRLVHVHATAVKAADPAERRLAQAVERMHVLVTRVHARQRELCLCGPRVSGALLHDVVAVHLAAAGRAAPQLHDALAAVSLLFRLANDYSAVAEPAELRAFRTDVLDAAITRALRELRTRAASSSGKDDRAKAAAAADALDLAALGEVAVVMCAEHTIHHISAEFFDELAAATESAAPRGGRGVSAKRPPPAPQTHSRDAEAAARILVAVAPVCRLRQDERTACFLRMSTALAPFLRAQEQIAVLAACDAAGAPAESAAVAAMRRDLAAALRSPDSPLAAPAAMAALSVLRGAARVPVATVLRRACAAADKETGGLGAGDAGAIARIAAPLLAAAAGEGAEDEAFLRALPAALAEAALRGRQHCPAADVPRVLMGFARLGAGDHVELQQRVMRAYILRTIQTCPQLSALEVVECLESFVAARVSHEYLYGVLLARVTDARVKFSLPLAVRLVDCGAAAAWDKGVQTACLTAAQPVFLGFVRRMLQSDPAALPAVSSHAVVVLRCLAEAFPNDPAGDLVLQCMATYHAALTTPTMIAVLRLISRKNSTEYAVLRCMTDHAVGALFPRASPNEFVELTLLLVQCGVRTRTLFEGVAQRFAALRGSCDGGVLATLAEAFTAAHVDLEPEVIAMLVARTVELAQETQKKPKDHTPTGNENRRAKSKRSHESHPKEEKSDPVMPLQHVNPVIQFELPHCIALLKLFALLDPEQTRRATSLLLSSAALSMRTGAVADSPADVDILLAACVRVAPVPGTAPPVARALTQHCADALLRALETQQPAGWETDLALLVQLAAHLVQLELAKHAAVPLLFDALYERRSALMRRRLLLQSATEAIGAAGEEAHQQLYALLVDGKLMA